MDKEQIFQALESWENMDYFIREVKSNDEALNILMDLALNDNSHVTWRAAWLVDKVHQKSPELIKPYLEQIVDNLKTQELQGKKRHFLKLISLHEVNPKYHGFLVDYCISSLTSAKEPIAIKAHAMQVLYNISLKEPEFRNELILILEHEITYHPTPGIVARGKKILQKLNKL